MIPSRAVLAGLSFGDGLPVAVMGVVNVSPESFHAESVLRRDDDLIRTALAMAEAGAALIDVGGRSTAPYLPTEISEAEECERLARAVTLLVDKLPVPVSADTTRPAPARAALEAGARVINDVSGLRDPGVAALVARHRAGVILMAAPARAGGARAASTTPAVTRPGDSMGPGSEQRAEATGLRGAPGPGPDPVATIKNLLGEALARARAAGITDERIVVDPGIGFFRDEGVPWDVWDARVLAGLGSLRTLGRPLCVGVSRKSFIGATTGRTATGERLAGSLAATTVAVWNGAALLRTHDVTETLDAVRVAERLRNAARAL